MFVSIGNIYFVLPLRHRHGRVWQRLIPGRYKWLRPHLLPPQPTPQSQVHPRSLKTLPSKSAVSRYSSGLGGGGEEKKNQFAKKWYRPLGGNVSSNILIENKPMLIKLKFIISPSVCLHITNALGCYLL